MNLGTYKKCHVDFIQYLNIVNSFLDDSALDENGEIKPEGTYSLVFEYNDTLFNNNFDINSNFNSEFRRLTQGNVSERK
jgi:hypothetical protein